ncbi:MAG: anthranilate phosphoribosyltransferase [Candidatus Margulisbacteria bacterium]|nr:anthranilate phosphoribosyltransferase [Candidatus Margulisiibacteriota bacterium]
MLLLIDNYDSFVYILKQYFEECGQKVVVKRNDEITVAQAEELHPDYLVISPGPATPKESGISMDMIRHFTGKIPILGVCLGHQCIGEIFGGKVIRNTRVMHGKRSAIYHNQEGLFKELPVPLMATRYHSLVIEKKSFPSDKLVITAATKEGEIMGVAHKDFPVWGVQFHPESYLTQHGMKIIKNFLSIKDYEPPVNIVVSSFGELVKKLGRKQDLLMEEAVYAANAIMEGQLNPVQVASFLSLLAAKGETYTEITGFARVMREKVTPIKHPPGRIVIDTCGTGGDSKHTFNISTAAAIVAAAAGIIVAKHGNRSVSSKCGSADLLEKLGVNVNLSADETSAVLAKTGIAFLFAQKLHTAMKNVGPIRKEIGIRTIFNILGPLTNPAGADAQIIGVFSRDYAELVALALKELGTKEALVLHSDDGLDEISVSDRTFYVHLKEGEIHDGYILPEDIIGKRYPLEAIKGAGVEENAQIMNDLMDNKLSGALKEVVLINAAAAIMIGGKVQNLKDGYRLARQTLESGKALAKLQELVRNSNSSPG